MGPYYDHASLQMWAFARTRRQRPDRALAPRSKGAAGSVWGERTGALAAGLLATPGVALAFGVAALPSGLGARDVWTIRSWRHLIGASIVVLVATVSSIRLFVAG